MLFLNLYNFKYGSRKVLFIYSNKIYETKTFEAIAKYNNLNLFFLEIFYFADKEYQNYLSIIKNQNINDYYGEYYSYIYSIICENAIDIVVILGTGYPYSKDFINKLKKRAFVVCYFGDDPEGSYWSSKSWVKYYDISFCGGVYFDKYKKILEKYLEWGAKKSYFIPLGVFKTKYLDKLPNFERKGAIEIIFIGSNPHKRLLRMLLLKLVFGNKLAIYGSGWDYHQPIHFIKKILMFLLHPIFKNIKKINSDEELIQIYRNAKIGINLHLSFGPSNLRSYELPINGVMEIADNSKGFCELYELNKEIVCCDNIFEIIKKTKFYLSHDAERIKIAKAGYYKTQQNYLTECCFKKIVDIIYSDEEYIKRIKFIKMRE